MTDVDVPMLQAAVAAGVKESQRNRAPDTRWATGTVATVHDVDSPERSIDVVIDGDPGTDSIQMRTVEPVEADDRVLIVFTRGGAAYCLGPIGGHPPATTGDCTLPTGGDEGWMLVKLTSDPDDCTGAWIPQPTPPSYLDYGTSFGYYATTYHGDTGMIDGWAPITPPPGAPSLINRGAGFWINPSSGQVEAHRPMLFSANVGLQIQHPTGTFPAGSKVPVDWYLAEAGFNAGLGEFRDVIDAGGMADIYTHMNFTGFARGASGWPTVSARIYPLQFAAPVAYTIYATGYWIELAKYAGTPL
jgi:hypothetical protein